MNLTEPAERVRSRSATTSGSAATSRSFLVWPLARAVWSEEAASSPAASLPVSSPRATRRGWFGTWPRPIAPATGRST